MENTKKHEVEEEDSPRFMNASLGWQALKEMRSRLALLLLLRAPLSPR